MRFRALSIVGLIEHFDFEYSSLIETIPHLQRSS